MSEPGNARRRVLARLAAGIALISARIGGVAARTSAAAPASDAAWAPDPHRWMDAAFAMKSLALSSGDQPYGAVVVLDEHVVGEGPSRVVKLGDSDAHAEREAIRDAQRRLGRDALDGAVLYSTSRPCGRCERVAAAARVARMVHGETLTDAGPPRS